MIGLLAALASAGRTVFLFDTGIDVADFGSIAEAKLIWYEIGAASGREGELWTLTDNGGNAKAEDWILPNNFDTPVYIRFSNLVGDNPTGDSFNAWHRLDTTERGQRLNADSSNVKLCTFDSELGIDGSTAIVGPVNHTLNADSS